MCSAALLILAVACNSDELKPLGADDTGVAATASDDTAADDTAADDTAADACDTGWPDEPAPVTAEELCAFDEDDLIPLAVDAFSRTDLGQTETGGYPYVTADGTGYVTVSGEALSLHYFSGSGGSVPDQWVNLGRLPLADFVLDLRMRPYSEDYDHLVGLSWRQLHHDGVRGHAGYHLFLEEGVLNLYAGHVLLDSLEVGADTAWHDYRVVANGDGHCVFRDGEPVLSARDATFTRAGYLGATVYYSIGSFDDLVVSEHPLAASMAGAPFDLWDDFARADGDPGTPWEVDGARIVEGALSVTGSASTAGTEAQELTFHAEGGDYGAWVRGDLRLAVSGGVITLSDEGGTRATEADDGLSHDYRVLTTGRSVRVYRDGIELFDLVDDSLGTGTSVGLFGTAATFDDVGIRELDPAPVYPAGALEFPDETRFPIVLYSADEYSIAQAAARGGNIVHSYRAGEVMAAYAEEAARHGVRVLGNVGTYYIDDSDPQPISVESDVTPLVERMAAGPNIGWWTVPEELRYWRTDELEELSNLAQWTRAHDPNRSPVFMYQAGHYTAEALAPTLPYLDIIGKGAYADYAGQPRAWVRHQLESTVEAIERAGGTVGADYLSGDKTPLVILGLWPDYPATAAEIYHDAFAGVVAGGRGIALFSYWYGLMESSGDGLDGFLLAAEQLDGDLGAAVLFGEPRAGVRFVITDGPSHTEEFLPYGLKEALQYDCLNVGAWERGGDRHVIAVNSCEEAVTATLSGFGVEVRVPHEERVVCPEDGSFEERFDPLGVHIYRF